MQNNRETSTNKAKFTVGVPTFDRHEAIKRLFDQLRRVDNQCQFQLIVSDNHSNPSVCSILDESDFKKKTIFLNREFNVGPIANILRLFEECATEWLIILGDDDEISPFFVNEIVSEINEIESGNIENIVAVKFRSVLNLHQNSAIIEGVEQFCEYNQSHQQFGSTLLISTWLFRVSELKKFIRFGYLYSSMQMPHIVPILMALKDKNKIKYTDKSPVLFKEANGNSRWDAGLTFILAYFNIHLFPEFKNQRQVKNISKIFVGNSFKSKIGFYLRLYYTYRHTSITLPYFWFMISGAANFFAGIVFLSLIPFLNIVKIETTLRKKLGITNDERM